MPRQKINIDPRQVEKMAVLGLTDTEIADILSVHRTTISKRFSRNLAKSRAARKMKLRHLQWRAAEQGNITMLIWLGKQELDQREPRSVDELTPATIVMNFGQIDKTKI